MDNLTHEDAIEAGQGWEVRRFRPEDAMGVVRLFHAVYGSDYPVRTYMEPELLVAENAAGRTISSVAVTPRGDIVGHIALFRSAPHPGAYESGAGAVHAAYRGGKGIFTRMAAHGIELANMLEGIDIIFGEPVCNHPFTQRLSDATRFVPRALEVDLMPAEAYVKEGSAQGRVAAFLDFFKPRSRPHTVYLPEIYRHELAFLYEGLAEEREIRPADEEMLAEGRTDIRPQIFASAGVARVAVHLAGRDFPARVASLEAELRQKGIVVVQMWLNLGEAWAGGAVSVLHRDGYFLGGVLPRWFDTDGMLMQKIDNRPNWEEIIAINDRYKTILDMVRKDWERSQKEKGNGY